MKTMYVVPKLIGSSVPCPDRTLLPAQGASVPRTTWWLRRLAQGDVIESQEPTAVIDDGKQDGEES